MRLQLTIFLFALTVSSLAQTNVWTGSLDNVWHRSCNWSLNHIPTCGEDVQVPDLTNDPDITGIAHCNTIELQGSSITDILSSGGGRLDVGLGGTCSGTITDSGGCEYLPNPSFEDFSSCPDNQFQMARVDHWMDGTNITSDYYNTCGYQFLWSNPPPMPLPGGGNGYVGMLWSSMTGNLAENVGVCLLRPLTSGDSYTFTFNIAADSAPAYPKRVVIYGTTDCDSLSPSGFGFLGPPYGTGCPSLHPSWVILGTSPVMTPNNTAWQAGSISFTAPSAIEAIIVSAECTQPATAPVWGGRSYYYLDDLSLF